MYSEPALGQSVDLVDGWASVDDKCPCNAHQSESTEEKKTTEQIVFLVLDNSKALELSQM